MRRSCYIEAAVVVPDVGRPVAACRMLAMDQARDQGMNRQNGRLSTRHSARLRFAGVVLLVIALMGCQGAERPEREPEKKFADGLTARQIFQNMRDAYQRAKAYRDQGVLYLSYQLDGRVIQEEQAWRQSWRSDGRRDALWYNAEIRGDGQRLGCFIYDLESGNLDGQWMLVRDDDGGGLRKVLADPIARYFAAGRSELPLRAAAGSSADLLIPPPSVWLGSSDDWLGLQATEELLRLDDAKVDGRPCYHLQTGSGLDRYDLWIDQQTLVLRQMTLPISLLDPLVTASSEIGDIQFFARLHGAEIDPPLADETFRVVPPKNSRAVQQFVAIPEPFPCETLGQPARGLRLLDDSGQACQPEQLAGKTTVLVWMSGLSGAGALARLGDLRALCDRVAAMDKVAWIGVIAEDHLDQAAGDNPVVSRSLSSSAKSLGLPIRWLFDQQLESARQIRLVNTPSVVVLDRNGNIEYARGLVDQNWANDLAGAIDRIEAGERLSREMLENYQQFVERYQRRLELVSAEKLWRDPINAGTSVVAERLPLNEVWAQQELRQPGNLVALPGEQSGGVIVLDGLRTVVEIDARGAVVRRQELPLPAGEAVTRLRVASIDGSLIFATFTPYGRTIYLWNHDWKPLREIKAEQNAQLLDCGFWLAGPESKLIVAVRDQGLVAFAISDGSHQLISADSFESVAVSPATIFAASRDGVVAFRPVDSGWTPQPLEVGSTVVRLIAAGLNHLILLAVDQRGEWHVGAGDLQSGHWDWTPIGPQIFEGDVESTAAWPAESLERIAVVDARGALLIKDVSRGSVGVSDLGRAAGGVTLVPNGRGEAVIVVSQGNSLKAYRLPGR